MFSSASRCWVKAVPTHTPKGELLAGWWWCGGGAGICTFHSTVHGGYVWLPKPGQCCHRPLGMLSPCRDLLRQCRRPRSHQVPLDSGRQVVVLALPGSHLASVLLPESLENQKCMALAWAVLRASRSCRTGAGCWRRGTTGPPPHGLSSSPPLLSHLALRVAVACSSCWGPELQPK